MELKILEIKESTGKEVMGPRDIYEMMREEALIDRECHWILHLNFQSHVIEKELVGMGTLFCVYAEPREIFKKAILNSAHSIVSIHNHPSGNFTPSEADRRVCKRLKKAGSLLGITLRDYIILSPDGYYSFDSHENGNEPLWCINCQKPVDEDYLVIENGLIFCPYCYEVYYGEKLDTWIPKAAPKCL